MAVVNTRRMKKGGWFWVDKDFIRAYGESVGISGIAVYSCLALFAGSNQTCYPSQGHIAKLIGCSRATVNKAIKTLVKNGLIRVDKRAGYPQTYRLLEVGCKTGLQRVPNISTEGVKQTDTNDNHLSSFNNNPILKNELIHSNVASKSKSPHFVIQSEPLALELADALGDHKNLSLYMSLVRKYPESALQEALRQVLAVPENKIRKSRAALFIHILKAYEKQ